MMANPNPFGGCRDSGSTRQNKKVTSYYPVPPPVPSVVKVLLLNLYHARGFTRLDLCHPSDHISRKRKDRLRVRRVLPFEHDRLPAVPALAHLRIKLDAPKKCHAEMRRHLFRPAAREDIDLMVAVRARKKAHVLDHAHKIHFHLPEHFDR